MTTRRERAYNRRMQSLIDGVGKLQDKEVKKVMAALEASRVEVAARVAETEWQAAYLPQLKEAVERAIVSFRQRYMSEHRDALGNIWHAGQDMVDGPLHFAGVRVLAPELSITQLEILQGFSADLINGLGADALKRINNEITLGLLGQKPQYEVMKAVGRNLEDPSVFKTIATRAETITRTEMGRVNSAAREARIQDVTEVGGTEPRMQWRKKWIHSGKFHARPNHEELDGKEVGMDEDFPGGIPYPHAPGLPAGEVINCG